MKIGDEQDWGICFYNNGTGRPGPDFSQVDFIKLPINPDKSYHIETDESFAPVMANYSITDIEGKSFFNNNISGAQVLPNGNALICVGGSGTYYEIDTTTKDLVWHYILPLNMDITVSQGNSAGSNSTFKLRRYPLDFPAFDGRDLTPQGPLEEEPFDPLPNCLTNGISLNNTPTYELSLAPNPTQNILNIHCSSLEKQALYIFNSLGSLVYIDEFMGQKTISIIDLPDGVYFIKTDSSGIEKFIIQRS